MFDQYQNVKVSRSLVHRVAEKAKLPAEEVRESLEASGIYPSKKKWLAHLDRFLLGLGAIFCLCGVVFFFAYNWDDMHKFVKLGLVEGALAVVGALTLIFRKREYAKKIGLTVMCGLTGALFALYGQIYQTGANAYDFFLGWTLCIALFVIISRFPPLWLLHLVLINTTIVLYAAQVLRFDTNDFLFLILFLVNAMAVIIWELMEHEFKGNRWFPRVVGIFAMLCITGVAIDALFDDFNSPGYYISFGVYILALLVGVGLYRRSVKDLFLLAVMFLSIIVFLTALTAKLLQDADPEMALLACAVIALGSTTFLVWQLVSINKKWEVLS